MVENCLSKPHYVTAQPCTRFNIGGACVVDCTFIVPGCLLLLIVSSMVVSSMVVMCFYGNMVSHGTSMVVSVVPFR